MEFALKAYRRMLGKLCLIQATLLMVTAIVFSYLLGADHIVATVYGGLVTILVTLLSGWRFKLATDLADSSPQLILGELYKGTIVRFVLAIALLAMGLGKLDLQPLAVITGFAVSQAGYFFAPLLARWGQQ